MIEITEKRIFTIIPWREAEQRTSRESWSYPVKGKHPKDQLQRFDRVEVSFRPIRSNDRLGPVVVGIKIIAEIKGWLANGVDDEASTGWLVRKYEVNEEQILSHTDSYIGRDSSYSRPTERFMQDAIEAAQALAHNEIQGLAANQYAKAVYRYLLMTDSTVQAAMAKHLPTEHMYELNTALMDAVIDNNIVIAKQCIKAGVKLFDDATDHYNSTQHILMYALMYSKVDMLKWLVGIMTPEQVALPGVGQAILDYVYSFRDFDVKKHLNTAGLKVLAQAGARISKHLPDRSVWYKIGIGDFEVLRKMGLEVTDADVQEIIKSSKDIALVLHSEGGINLLSPETYETVVENGDPCLVKWLLENAPCVPSTTNALISRFGNANSDKVKLACELIELAIKAAGGYEAKTQHEVEILQKLAKKSGNKFLTELVTTVLVAKELTGNL